MHIHMFELTTSMPTMTQNISQLVLTKHIPCQRGQKINLHLCSPITSHASEYTKSISTCVDQPHSLPTSSQNSTQYVKTKPILNLLGDKMHLSMWWTFPSHASDYRNPSQPVLTKPIHASENGKCTSTCVDQTQPLPTNRPNTSHHVLNKRPPIPPRPQNALHALTKSLPVNRGHNMHLTICWQYTSHAIKETKCISTRVHQTPHMPGRAQNVSQHV